MVDETRNQENIENGETADQSARESRRRSGSYRYEIALSEGEPTAVSGADAEPAASGRDASAADAADSSAADAAVTEHEVVNPEEVDADGYALGMDPAADEAVARAYAWIPERVRRRNARRSRRARGRARQRENQQPENAADDTPEQSGHEAGQPGIRYAEGTTTLEAARPTGELNAEELRLISTSLVFLPPAELPPLPARKDSGRRPAARDDEDDEDEYGDDEGDDERASGTRRRSRRRTGRRERAEVEPITVPQKIKGSTRLEAKKQRRREGRDAGRRRHVVTESEFLARRESVDRQMIVRELDNRVQIGVLEDSVLVEHYVARSRESSLIGNVYLGRVQNVLPSMEAAFVDIGRGRNAVLYAGEVDWDAADGDTSSKKPHQRRIESALKSGDRVLVQVTKDPVGHKGARLTSQISLPGRYLVYVPGGSMNGISRKLPDTERSRLKKILKEILPNDAGVIVRTAAEGATEEQLKLDVERLMRQWERIQQKREAGAAPAMLHSEPDLLIKIVRDVFNEDFQKLIVSGEGAHDTIRDYLENVAPDLIDRLETYTEKKDIFDHFRVTEQIEKALDRKVWLPSGGSLVIDRTEAMTVIDVNTGKFVGTGGNLEETVTKNNLEAAEEIVRQLRLRDSGGIIVVDFIDMVLESNRDLVLRRLLECLSRDRTKHQVAEVTSLGLVQMTRKKLGLGLLETFSEACEECDGRGVIVQSEPVERKAPTDSVRGRRSRGQKDAKPQQHGGAQQPATVTHGITQDARNALTKIAASTLAQDDAPVPVREKAAEVAERVVAEQVAKADQRDSSKNSNDTRENRAENLALPEARKQAERHHLSKAAASLLDSVLDALPSHVDAENGGDDASGENGRGRRPKRSRRAKKEAKQAESAQPDEAAQESTGREADDRPENGQASHADVRGASDGFAERGTPEAGEMAQSGDTAHRGDNRGQQRGRRRHEKRDSAERSETERNTTAPSTPEQSAAHNDAARHDAQQQQQQQQSDPAGRASEQVPQAEAPSRGRTKRRRVSTATITTGSEQADSEQADS